MQRIFKWVFALIVIAVLHSGCTTPNTVSLSAEEFLREKPEQAVPISELAAGASIEVSVEVDGNMEVLSHRAEINHQGIVTLPLVGDVKVGGCTLSQARDVVLKTYSGYYVSAPVIMINVLDDAEKGEWGSVTVMGCIGNPGRVPLRASTGMNLTEAIQEAGGFKPSAKTSSIRVSRVDAAGKKLKITVDYDDIGRKGDAAADIKLIDGDIIYVPERSF